LSQSEDRVIKVDYLARVEGEGALYVRVKDDAVEEARLRIFEPPRFFEAFLRGRAYTEAPDVTARICGICPVAYQMSAVHAMEAILGVELEGQLRALRRLLYCGEWIESHGLHVFMLHAPDFLGYPDVIQMAKDHPQVVQDALALKKAGNAIVTLLGGREIHPINVRVGGFYRAPTAAELRTLLPQLERGLEIAKASVAFTAGLSFPDLERDYEFVSLSHPNEYPMNRGRVVSSKGIDIDVADYDDHFEEIHVEYTHALQSRVKGRGSYLAGPLARYSLNHDKLRPAAQEAAAAVGLEPSCRNPFKSIVVRAVELVHAFDEAISIIEGYVRPSEPAVEAPVRAGTGHAVTEAPRGLLYHRYSIDAEGLITDAKIVPPTSQNQSCIEEDLKEVVQARLHLDQAELTHACEQAIRNYDPCISCATHFLKLEIDRQ
jgi:coenzyme F420-reducing hydrogenase alpha subunit